MLSPSRRSSAGFTLIELMVSIVVLAILLGFAVPSFSTWLMNMQVRNAGSSITNGLQRARAEAVSRNTSVAFALGANSAWTSSVVSPASEIEARAASDGSQNVTRTVLPANATTITFNNLGIVTANADASATITRITLAATGATQSLQIRIGTGGNARLCDPSLPSSNASGC